MLCDFIVFLDNDDSFLEQVLIDLPSFLLRDQHHCLSFNSPPRPFQSFVSYFAIDTNINRQFILKQQLLPWTFFPSVTNKQKLES